MVASRLVRLSPILAVSSLIEMGVWPDLVHDCMHGIEESAVVY